MKEAVVFDWPVYAVQQIAPGRWIVRAIELSGSWGCVVAVIDEPAQSARQEVENETTERAA